MANGNLPHCYSPQRLVDEIVNEIRFQCTFGKFENVLEAFRDFCSQPTNLELLYGIYKDALIGRLPGPADVVFFDEMKTEEIEFMIDAQIPEVSRVMAWEQQNAK